MDGKGKTAPKKGRKGRKIGKGDRKISRSKWKSYSALIDHSNIRREIKHVSNHCKNCDVQFHSRAAKKRHDCN